MTNSDFILKLQKLWEQKKFICVGLDSDYLKIPQILKENKTISESIFEFNKAIIDKTADLVCSFKPQISFYEAYGTEGFSALDQTIKYLKANYPQIPVVLDAKRGDISSTNESYAKAYFDNMGFDALTVNPYLGKESLKPFLDYKDKGIVILVRTSNVGAKELQDLQVEGRPLYQVIAQKIAEDWNENGNCCVVVGATYPDELKKVREIVGDIPILVPGIGVQGGDLEAVLKNGLNSKREGLIINSSRGIIYASSESDFADSARNATQELDNRIRSLL